MNSETKLAPIAFVDAVERLAELHDAPKMNSVADAVADLASACDNLRRKLNSDETIL